MADINILPITADVSWIGVLDPGLITFDIVMETKYGTTYNSYFINADKKAIIETTKEKFWPTYLVKIKQVVDPADLEYIIVDPGSTDGSRELISSYGDQIIKVFQTDQGPADGLNQGFARATGDIYGFINSDDYRTFTCY